MPARRRLDSRGTRRARARGRWLALGLGAAALAGAACTTGVAETAAPGPTAGVVPTLEPTAIPTPSPAPEPRSFTIVASGDVLVHSPVAAAAAAHGDGAYDFRPMFDRVRPLVRAGDLGICHLETPVSRDNSDLSYYPTFNVPRQVVPALRYAGYDLCSVASNHALDSGRDGIASTLDALDAAGIEHDGTARNRREGVRPAYVRAGGVKVALLSYTYGLNGFTLPPDAPWAVNLIAGDRILADARAARRNGAEFVIVALHWGVEYVHAPTDAQSALARRMARSRRIDLVLGHHAHVVQPIGRLARRYVVYGMGNFLSNQSSDCCPVETQDGVLVHVRVVEVDGRFVVRRVLYTPTWVHRGPYRILPVRRALRNPGTDDSLRPYLRASLARTRSYIEALGTKGVRASADGFDGG